MVIVYPLTDFESRTIQWVTRVVPVVATAVIVLLGAISIATAGS